MIDDILMNLLLIEWLTSSGVAILSGLPPIVLACDNVDTWSEYYKGSRGNTFTQNYYY